MVAVSIAIAICASYTAFELAGRTALAQRQNKIWWLASGAMALGMGIWAMHYIGMLAFRLPVPVLYDVPLVLVSLAVAIASSWVALFVVSQETLSKLSIATGSLVVGAGITVMHYSGMAAMRLAAYTTYSVPLVAASAGIALAASFAGLQMAFRLRDPTKQHAQDRLGVKLADQRSGVFLAPLPTPILALRRLRNPLSVRVAAAVIMGLAIAAMHYTGMAAVCFHSAQTNLNLGHAVPVSGLGVMAITSVAFMMLALSLIGVLADRHFTTQQKLLEFEQERWRLVISANQGGLFDADLVAGTTFHSDRWNDILGYGADELESLNEAWEERLHPDDRKVVKTTRDQYLRDGQGVFEMEYRMRHRDGTWRWILARAQGVWDVDGRPVRLVGSHTDITQRKQSLEDLKASEARFAAFMRHNPCAAFIKSAEGRISYANPTLEKTWGLQPNAWINKPAEAVWPAALADGSREQDGSIASGIPVERLAAIETPNGTRWFLTTNFTFPDASGGRALGGIAVDMTERVEAEVRLRTSETRYRELFEQNPLPSWVYSPDTLEILDVNEAAIEHYGWPRSEFVGLNLRSIRMPGQAEAVEAQLRQYSLRNQRTEPIQHRRNNKSNIWVEISSHEIETPGYKARLVMANDITARLNAEMDLKQTQEQLESLVAQRTEELQTSEAKWRGLVEALPQFVWASHPNGTVDYVSNQWEEYTGVPVAELLGSGFLSTLHPADAARTQTQRLAARERNEPYEVEYRIRGRDGTYRWFVARGRPVRASGNGPVTHWLGTSTDIEDQKRSEERLESAVAERTLALEEARHRAEGAAQAKSAFMAAMSHEIRTPMNAVIGMTNLMLDMPLNSDQRCYLDTIRASGEALLSIINDVLDFSKIEAGKMELENVEFDLQTLLEESVDLVAGTAAAKDLGLSLDVEDGVPFSAVGDPGRLRQILLNLLSNAVKFTEHGSVSLSVSRAALQEQVMMLRFAVRDSGIGMSPDQQAGLFQAFTQADRSTTRRFGGTGLGLSIAKRLVELMGGTIGVSSQLGEGAVFWFNICVTPGAVLGGEVFAESRGLLIDCDPTSSQVVRRYLERAGMQVLDAAAAAAFPNSPISVVVANASSLNGAEEVNAMAARGCPVIVIGSPADWLSSDATPAFDIAAYVPKPVRCLPLLKAVQAAMRGNAEKTMSASPDAEGCDLQDAGILVVEDNRVNQLIVRLLLEKLGCRVEIACNGREACAALQERCYDLVLMDCQMPEMDGFEATRIIREREVNSRTPIIALTAGVMKEERDQCYAAGMDGFLSKPISRDELKSTLESWLTVRRVI